jgi:hypothetical protein
MISIPFSQNVSSKFYFTIALENDGVFTLSFFFNTRDNAWFMDILNSVGDTVLLAGVRLSVGYFLLQQYHGTEGLPKGDFIVYDELAANLTNTETSEDLSFDNIGIDQRFTLLYVTEAELYGI